MRTWRLINLRRAGRCCFHFVGSGRGYDRNQLKWCARAFALDVVLDRRFAAPGQKRLRSLWYLSDKKNIYSIWSCLLLGRVLENYRIHTLSQGNATPTSTHHRNLESESIRHRLDHACSPGKLQMETSLPSHYVNMSMHRESPEHATLYKEKWGFTDVFISLPITAPKHRRWA